MLDSDKLSFDEWLRKLSETLSSASNNGLLSDYGRGYFDAVHKIAQEREKRR